MAKPRCTHVPQPIVFFAFPSFGFVIAHKQTHEEIVPIDRPFVKRAALRIMDGQGKAILNLSKNIIAKPVILAP